MADTTQGVQLHKYTQYIGGGMEHVTQAQHASFTHPVLSSSKHLLI